MHNLGQEDLANLIYGVVLLSFLISGYFFRGTIEKSKAMKQIGIWLAIIFVITVAYGLKDKWISAFVPSKPNVTSNKIEVSKSSDSHFYISMKINDKSVLFLVDTGATDTTLNIKDAKKVGINVDKLIYNKRYSTANGTIYGASATVKKVEIENLVFNDVGISVNQNDLTTSLLGINFLNKFKSYEIRGDKLILYY